jgi:hypothetical protein
VENLGDARARDEPGHLDRDLGLTGRRHREAPCRNRSRGKRVCPALASFHLRRLGRRSRAPREHRQRDRRPQPAREPRGYPNSKKSRRHLPATLPLSTPIAPCPARHWAGVISRAREAALSAGVREGGRRNVAENARRATRLNSAHASPYRPGWED